MKTPACLFAALGFMLAQHGAAQYAGWAVGHVADGYGTIVATVDSGATWVRQGSSQVASATVSGIYAVDPSSAWAVGASDGGYATIYHTTDGGITWTRKGFGQTALLDVSLLKVHASSNTVWAVGEDAILRSSDAGATWTNCLPATYTNRHYQAVFSLDGEVVWVGGEDTNGGTQATVLHSTNAGNSWVRQVITPANHILGISAVDRQTAWAVGGSGFVVFRTDDGGDTWHKQPSPGGVGDANEVSAVNTQVVYVAVDNFIEWTTNDGTHWTSTNLPYYVMGISAVDDQEAWAVSTGGTTSTGLIFHTVNGGGIWEAQVLSSGGKPAPLWNVSFARTQVPEPGAAAVVLLCVGASVRRGRARQCVLER